MTPTAAHAEARRIVRESRRLADQRTRVDPNQPTPDWRLARDAALVEQIAKALEREFWPSSKPMFWWGYASGAGVMLLAEMIRLWWWSR